MTDTAKHKNDLLDNGFTTIDNIYSTGEVKEILATIEKADKTNETFRKSADLFAIRQFLKEVPEAIKHIFNDNLQTVIRHIFGDDYFAVKSIYFDKPETSNWYVSYHQDLTISVDKKLNLDGFGPWTVKQNQFAVQPPLYILKNIFTIFSKFFLLICFAIILFINIVPTLDLTVAQVTVLTLIILIAHNILIETKPQISR